MTVLVIPSGEIWGDVAISDSRMSFAWTVVVYDTPNPLVVIVPSIDTLSFFVPVWNVSFSRPIPCLETDSSLTMPSWPSSLGAT